MIADRIPDILRDELPEGQIGIVSYKICKKNCN